MIALARESAQASAATAALASLLLLMLACRPVGAVHRTGSMSTGCVTEGQAPARS